MNSYFSPKSELTENLITGVRQNSKGKGRFNLAIYANIPGVGGSLSARQIGLQAVNELVDRIRINWEYGRYPDGKPGPGVSEDQTGPNKRASIGQSATARLYRRRLEAINMAKRGVALEVYIYRQQIVMQNDAQGARRRVKYLKVWFTPKRENIYKSFNFSGLMMTSLKGRFRPGHNQTTPAGTSTMVSAGWELSVAKSRQECAAAYCGLSAPYIYRMFELNQLPETAFYLRKAVFWTNVKETAEAVRNVAELVSRGFEQLSLFAA